MGPSPKSGRARSIWEATAALRTAVFAGALSGAVIGGVGGRIAMRIVALVDESAEGARTDFGATVGDITAGGTITLTVMTMIAGIVGGALYMAMRRWLPGSGVVRGLSFGVVMVFGPGLIAIGEVDLQIFEPALPIFAMFAAVQLMYGIVVAIIFDRLHPAVPVTPGRRVDVALRALHCVAAVGVCIFAVLFAMHIINDEGTCLTAGPEGGCAARPAR